MTAHTNQGLRFALEYVEGVFGANLFPITENRCRAWKDQLRDLDDVQLAEGVRRACIVAKSGYPPLPKDIIEAIHGRWVVEKRRGIDNFGASGPDCPIEAFTVLYDWRGATERTFDSRMNLVDNVTLIPIASRERVVKEMPHLLPPSERERLTRPADYLAPKVDFKNRLNGLLGQ